MMRSAMNQVTIEATRGRLSSTSELEGPVVAAVASMGKEVSGAPVDESGEMEQESIESVNDDDEQGYREGPPEVLLNNRQEEEEG